MQGTLAVTNHPDANELLNRDPLALLLGMLLDQQVPMEWAFLAPLKLRERLGGTLDAATIAALGPEKVEEIFRDKPALHRFPGSMGKRAHAVCQHIVDHYGGDTEAIWSDVATGDELLRRLKELPGFGDEKSMIFVALLAKRMGVRPEGWERCRRPVRRPRAPLGGRHRLQGVPGPRPRVEAGQEEGRPDQAGLTPTAEIGALSPRHARLGAPISGQECWWRSSQPRRIAIARGSWRSWWPAPAMIRSSALPCASPRTRASKCGTASSSEP